MKLLTVEELANLSTKYRTPYKNVYINYAADAVSISLSGGFDSAVMLYLIAKTLHDTNSTAEIQPYTTRRSNPTLYSEYDRADAYVYANKVVDYIKEKFPSVKINNLIKRDADYWWVTSEVNGANVGSYTETMIQISRFLTWDFFKKHKDLESEQLLHIEYIGTTKNPPPSEVTQSDEKHRDFDAPGAISKKSATVIEFDTQKPYQVYYQPFRNADKRVTVWLADSFGILDDLLLITKTCEGGPIETENFTKECMECWWCLEKKWALENYKQDKK